MPKTLIDMTTNNDDAVLKIMRAAIKVTSNLNTIKNVEDINAKVKVIQALRAQMVAIARKS
jgi:hypothetical protein